MKSEPSLGGKISKFFLLACGIIYAIVPAMGYVFGVSAPHGETLAFLLLAFLFSCAMFLRENARINATLMVSIILFGGVAMDLFLFHLFFSSLDKPVQLINAVNSHELINAGIDTRSKREVASDLRKSGMDAYPFYSWAWINAGMEDEVVPIGGAPGKVMVMCNENGYWITYKADEYGFANPPGLWRVGAQIAVVGDSFAQGFCARNDFTTLIRKQYPATVNLAMAGAGPLMEVAALREYAPIIKPEIVLWFYYEGNDLGDLRRESETILRHYLTDGKFTQHLAERRDEIGAMVVDYLKGKERFFTFANMKSALVLSHLRIIAVDFLLSRTKIISGMADGVVFGNHESMDQLFAESIREAKKTLAASGGKLVFVYLPEYSRFADTAEYDDSMRKKILDIVRTEGVTYIDIAESFKRTGDPMSLFPKRIGDKIKLQGPTRINGHYNEEGHSLVAGEVLSFLERGVISGVGGDLGNFGITPKIPKYQ